MKQRQFLTKGECFPNVWQNKRLIFVNKQDSVKVNPLLNDQRYLYLIVKIILLVGSEK